MLEDLDEIQFKYFNTYLANGVGSRSFPINPRDFIFKHASKQHDFQYFVGGNEEERRWVDGLFLSDCFKAIGKAPIGKRPFYTIIAIIYFGFLVALGSYAWEYTDKPAETWDEFLIHVDVFFSKNPKYKKPPSYEEYLKSLT